MEFCRAGIDEKGDVLVIDGEFRRGQCANGPVAAMEAVGQIVAEMAADLHLKKSHGEGLCGIELLLLEFKL